MQAVIGTQTFGEFLGFNPHCHVLVTDGFSMGRARQGRKAVLSIRKCTYKTVVVI